MDPHPGALSALARLGLQADPWITLLGASVPEVQSARPGLKRSQMRRTPTRKATNKSKSFNKGRTGLERCAVLALAPEVRAELGPCGGIGANHGDHRAERSARPDLIGDPENRQTLCPAHHQWKTDNGARAKEIGLRLDESYERANRDPMAKVIRQLAED